MDESVIFIEELRSGDADVLFCESNEIHSGSASKSVGKKSKKSNKPPIICVDLCRDIEDQESNTADKCAKRNENEHLGKKLECPICLEPMQNLDMMVTPCGHLFCKQCIEHISGNLRKNCAKCRKVFKKKDLLRIYL